MVDIQTVRGPVPLDTFGPTMMHEHCLGLAAPKWREKNIAVARQELQELVDCGGRTVVDVGPFPERDISMYQELNHQVDLNIVVCTGFYLQRWTPQEFWDWPEERLADRFMQELTEGINGTSVRAAIIKVASDKAQLTDWEHKVFRAAARVQVQTGVPICCHSCEGARSQFLALTSAGADPERIYHSHVEAEFGWEGRNLQEQLEYLTWLARAGASLYFNNFGFEWDTPHRDLMYLMHSLCDRGYTHRVLFGVDANYSLDDEGNVWWEAQQEHPEAGVRDFAYTYTGAIPLMRQWGFTAAHFQVMLEQNPQRMFNTTRI
ncbi:MAG: hypothetical protein ACUVX9_02060 [Anaerolineae bacterium]